MTSSTPRPGRSLADLHPGLAAQWHPTRNGDLTPSKVTPASNKKIWWLGDCGHEWDAPPTSRTTKGAGCPVCTGKRVVPGINDLSTTAPHLVGEWHPTRNAPLLPSMVTSRSSRKVWWLGQCGHEWEVAIGDRTAYSTGCPYCFGNLRVSTGSNDLATLNPALADEWHPTRNRGLDPTEVRQFSTKKVWWLGDCGHEWRSTIAHRSNGRACPFCKGKKVLAGFNDLSTTDPEVAREWHQTKNGSLEPTAVSRGSDRKVWWISHGHEWKSTISSRAMQGQGCAICSGDQVQPGTNDLATTHPDAAIRWHPSKNGSVTPKDVTGGSGRRYWWFGECGHTWKATPKHLTSGRGCAVCRGLQIEIGINDLESQYPDLAAQWHPSKNGTLTPRDVTSSSARKVWWVCNEGHEWRTGVNGRQYGTVGCPSCAKHGFSPSKDGWLYFLFHPVWHMQQIGITNVPEQRLGQHTKLGWEVTEVRGPMDGALAKALEREALMALHSRGARLGKRSNIGRFDGYTESWPITSLELVSLNELLNWVYSDEIPISISEQPQSWSPPSREPRRSTSGLLRGTDTPAICKLDGCVRKHHGYGYCRLHYRRWITTGDTGPVSTLKAPNGTNKTTVCKVQGCTRNPVGRGLCSLHYSRSAKPGDAGSPESTVVPRSERICVVDGCAEPWMSRRMCEIHYRRFMSNGDPHIVRRGGKPKSKCSMDGCERPAFGLGYCNRHYKRYRRHGDPNGGRSSS